MAPKKQKKRKVYSKTKASKNTPVARRGLMVSSVVLLIALVLFGAYQLISYTGSLFFSRNPHFQLRTVEMASDGRLSPAQLIEYAAVEQGVNLFAVDFDTIRQNLLSVPMVESVRIQRQLPDTLKIWVVERTAVAQIRWQRRGLPFLLDRNGIVLPATRSGQSLPLIEGASSAPPRPGDRIQDAGVGHVLAILTAADELGLGSQVRFESFDLRNPNFITAQLNDDVSARFPRHSAREKLVRLVRVLQIAREQGRRVKTVDLTPDGRNVPVTDS